jgi:hypothetical protein
MTDYWECDGCGGLNSGNFRMGIKDHKTGKPVYVVECPTCGHSGYKTDEDIEHTYKNAKKRWVRPHEELERMTENQRLRQHGFHDIANKYTEIINPKREREYNKWLENDIIEDIRDGSPIWREKEIDELRKKKSSKAKPKRKSIKKVVKKCKCK